jgi:hypothetical protein
LVGVEAADVVAATFAAGEVSHRLGRWFGMGSDGGFYIGPLGGTDYGMHMSKSCSRLKGRTFSFDLRETSLDALQFLPRKRVVGFKLDRVKEVYVSYRF